MKQNKKKHYTERNKCFFCGKRSTHIVYGIGKIEGITGRNGMERKKESFVSFAERTEND